MQGAPSLCQKVEVCIEGETSTVIRDESINHMIYEFAYFRDQVASQKRQQSDELLALALSVSKVLTEARENVGLIFE